MWQTGILYSNGSKLCNFFITSPFRVLQFHFLTFNFIAEFIVMKKKALPLFLFSGTLLLLFTMRWHGEVLTKFPSTKAGIVSLEFAKTKKNVTEILYEWNTVSSKNIHQHAVTNTAIDFLFIFFYSLFLFYACFWFSIKQQGLLSKLSRFISLLALVAGLLDVIENYFLLKMLSHSITDAEVLLTWWIAAVKFSLAGIAVVWILINIPMYFIFKPKTKTS